MQAKSSATTRRAMLGLALDKHPEELTPADLRREFGEAAWQAVVDLQADELLRWDDGRIRPTRAALSFYRLELP